MSEVKQEQNGPRSDFSSSLDKDVVVKFRGKEYQEQLGLGAECPGRLVGVDRYGLWLEPAEQRKSALAAGESVAHYFIPWDEVLTVVRRQEASLFQTKKEYRGLRPQ
ncbi:MAG: hypothetical protein KF760_22215 [Candidatus Eremiobacteraeota bacterium]|nr:hypothetical protein [Candidatus Eremiobacteraeota bacterium]MCW5866459.1 hypothetical protein [Candidatus Eremiobacteraeota bacterium]